MYCGNNRLDPKIISGELTIGDRYRCFKKGIGKGLTLPPYNNNDYDPIDREKIYCGKSNILPEGYSRLGSNVQCFRKGVGVGKTLDRNNARSPIRSPIPDGGHNPLPPIIPTATPGINRWSNDHPNQALLATFSLIVLFVICSISLGKTKTVKYTLLGPFSTIL